MQTENEQGLLRRSDALTLEEIQASTDLTGKIASASALNIVRKLQGLVITSINDTTDIAQLDSGLYFITGPISPINGVQGAYNTLYIINDNDGWRSEFAICANNNSIYFRTYHSDYGIEPWLRIITEAV